VPAPLVIPTAAKMVTGAIIGAFTQKGLATTPYVAANVSVNPTTSASGGLSRPAVLKKLVATGYTARRVVVDAAKCNTCHDQLGTNPSFHGGARNDPTACAFCHTTNAASGGWSYNASTFLHGIHGASKRTTGYTWQVSLGYATLGYPGVLKDCEQCHVANTVNYGANGATVAPSLLATTVATGTTSAAGTSTSPYISQVAGTKYGLGFSYTTPGQAYSSYTLVDGVTVIPAGTAGPAGFTREAESTTLVSSPISAACYACHDTDSAKNHMRTQGGAVYEPRATASQKGEACLVCHGAGKDKDAVAVHK
jgi:OmcA/MtrC family decaheme c-type cytochrome